MKNQRLILLVAMVAIFLFAGGQALAQEGEEGHSHGQDPTTTPLVVPAIEDFAPPPGGEVDADGQLIEVAPVGVNGYFEFSEQNKVFNITPRYRFNETWAAKLRVPWIAERKVEIWGDEVSASGIGDVAVEGEYTHPFDTPGQLLRLQGSVKLPTGDDGHTEDLNGSDVVIPLGSGSLDYMLRGQYTRSTATTGLLASAMFRKNSTGEREYVSDVGGIVTTQTTETTNGNQFFAALFGRKMVSEKVWLNLGASVMFTGDGSVDYKETDSSGYEWDPDEYDMTTKSTMIDLYPGVSYDLGIITPYIGARIPVSTSFDADGMNEDRDTVFLFQISYRPLKMTD